MRWLLLALALPGSLALFKSLRNLLLRSPSSSEREAPQPSSRSVPQTTPNPPDDGRLWEIPPLLLVLLHPESCEASPLNPQAVRVRGPFFQGWLFRTVDHLLNVSAIVIVGSFSSEGSEQYDEHYICCGVNSPTSGHLHFEVFPPPHTVQIAGDLPSSYASLANITWTAEGIGYFHLDGDQGHLKLAVEDLHIKMKFRRRRGWAEANDRAGPEGWLAYTPLLPCHYSVHSVGSDCDYSIACNQLRCRGSGFTHIEGNHGTFFPEGWVWSQAIGNTNDESFSMIGGRFVIGVLSPINWVIYLRTKSQRYIFRTTDMCSIKYSISPIDGRVAVTGTSFDGRCKIELTIESSKLESYGPPIYIPTSSGFQNNPGCREIYTAVVEAKIFEFKVDSRRWELCHELRFEQAALEFGGQFQLLPQIEKR